MKRQTEDINDPNYLNPAARELIRNLKDPMMLKHMGDALRGMLKTRNFAPLRETTDDALFAICHAALNGVSAAIIYQANHGPHTN